MGIKVNYTIVGLFVLSLGSSLIAFAWWLSFDPKDQSYHDYLMFFNESISGLNLKAPVKFNGVDVGYVKNIQLNPHNLSQVKLLAAIEQDIPITTSTRATVQLQGLTGIAYIGLKVGDPKAPLLTPKKPYRYPAIATEPSLLFRLDTALREITHNLDRLTHEITTLFDDENIATLHQGLHHTTQLTKMLADNTASMQRTLKNTEHLTKKLSVASDRLPELMHNMTTFSQQLKQIAAKGDTAVQSFSEQAMPATVHSLDQLQHVLSSTQTLLEKINHTPTILLRGEIPSARGPGE